MLLGLVVDPLLLCGGAGKSFYKCGIDENGQIKQEENQIICDIDRISKAFRTDQYCQCKNTGHNHLPQLEVAPHQISSVRHIQQHKAVEEAETIGDHICKMETMPNIIQLPDNKADDKE